MTKYKSILKKNQGIPPKLILKSDLINKKSTSEKKVLLKNKSILKKNSFHKSKRHKKTRGNHTINIPNSIKDDINKYDLNIISCSLHRIILRKAIRISPSSEEEEEENENLINNNNIESNLKEETQTNTSSNSGTINILNHSNNNRNTRSDNYNNNNHEYFIMPPVTGLEIKRQRMKIIINNSLCYPIRNVETLTDIEQKECVICRNEFENEQIVRILPCTHFFHKECIDKWLQKKMNCPSCKLCIKDYDPENPIKDYNY